MSEILKTCPKCKKSKLLTEFHNNRSEKDGKAFYCKSCVKGKSKHYNDHRRQAFKMYGLTLKDYQSLLSSQGGVCAICNREPREGKRHCVDHDHETGQVRGLLCNSCNVGIGALRDDVSLLLKAAEYLQNRRQAPPAFSRRAAEQLKLSTF